MRGAGILSLAALLSACEFFRVAPVPGASVSQRPQNLTPISTLATQEVCVLRFEEGYYNQAIDELEARGVFTDFELVQIRAADVAAGMSAEAVQCAFGPPQQILTRSIGDEYDMAYQYDRVLFAVQTRVFFANGVVAEVEDNPLPNRGSRF